MKDKIFWNFYTILMVIVFPVAGFVLGYWVGSAT
jgi:hypothetical protein